MNPETQIECPLCKEMVQFSSHLRRHLGKHQEQLALFALPSNLEQTEEENESDIADNGPASKEDLASDTSRADGEQDISAEMNLADMNRESDLEAAPVASAPATSPETRKSLSLAIGDRLTIGQTNARNAIATK